MTVKIRMYGGKICAQIPSGISRLATQIRSSRYNAKWKCWCFNPQPHIAHEIVEKFRHVISYIDADTTKLAASYSSTQAAKSDMSLPDIPNMKRKAWNHQRQAYHFAENLPGAILAMGMGTGKTMTSIGLIQQRPHATILIVAPKSVISVWPTEFDKHATEKFSIYAPNKGTIAEKTEICKKKLKFAESMKRPFVLILNYEAVWRDSMAKWLKGVMWDQIIYDEIHRIKAPKSKASCFAFSMIKHSKFRLGLTGTLLPHSPLDAFAQFKAIDPAVFGSSFFRFRNRYAVMGGFGGKQVIKFDNQLEMNQKIESISYQVGSEVLDLPPIIHNYRTCILTKKTRSLYTELNDDLYAAIDSGEINIPNAMVKILRLQQLTSGYLKIDDGTVVQYGTEKYDIFCELLGEINKKEPVVIFCRFTSDIVNVQKACEKAGRTCAELSGQKNNLKDWQMGKYNCIAVQIRSGGVGIDLTRACYCVYYSIGHSLGDYSQSLARTHRPGQKKTVNYYHLLAENTVDPLIYAALKKKEKIVDYVLKGVKLEFNAV